MVIKLCENDSVRQTITNLALDALESGECRVWKGELPGLIVVCRLYAEHDGQGRDGMKVTGSTHVPLYNVTRLSTPHLRGAGHYRVSVK